MLKRRLFEPPFFYLKSTAARLRMDLRALLG
jgi:hypothetical protein